MPIQIYVKATFEKTSKEQLRREIMQEQKENKAFRKEIARVFQVANRRIQNIEKSGLYSPAVAALSKGDIDRFTKFSMHHDWDALKIEYGKAIAFLRQPTSLVSGLRQYNKYLQNAYDLTEDEFNLMSRSLHGKVNSISNTRFVEKYLMRYKDFTGELEQEAQSLSGQIESEAMNIRNAIDREVEEELKKALKAQRDIQKWVDNFNRGSW